MAPHPGRIAPLYESPHTADSSEPTTGKGYYPRGGSFMLITNWFPAQTTWSGNVWDDTGSSIAKP